MNERNCDEEMNQADLELQQMGFEALDRCLKNGADPDDLRTVAWIAGLKWTPKEDAMAKVGEMIESKYLKQSDVEDEVVVTIQKVGKANVAREGDEPEYKWLVRFEELPKPMVLNSTNIKRLAKACNADDTDQWIGQKVVLYVDHDVEFAGNVVGGLRIRAHRTAPTTTATRQVQPKPTGGKFDDMADDIPF